MKYIMILWPHSNVRYQNETLKLAESELRLMLDIFAPAGEISVYTQLNNLPALQLDLPENMDKPLMHAVKNHSLMYGLFELAEGGLLKPVAGRADAYVGADLPGILKYKGKTNELFLQLLVNAALYSGGFAHRGDEALELLDQIEALAHQEMDNARACIPAVETDSRIGWEPSMEYVCDRWHLEWKLRQVESALREVAIYRSIVENAYTER